MRHSLPPKLALSFSTAIASAACATYRSMENGASSGRSAGRSAPQRNLWILSLTTVPGRRFQYLGTGSLTDGASQSTQTSITSLSTNRQSSSTRRTRVQTTIQSAPTARLCTCHGNPPTGLSSSTLVRSRPRCMVHAASLQHSPNRCPRPLANARAH